jgi:hypothetical protein
VPTLPSHDWAVEATKQDLDRVAADLRDEMRELRAQLYRARRQQDLIVTLMANAVLVSVIVTMVHLLTT